MPAFLKKPWTILVILAVVVVGGGFAYVQSQAKTAKAKAVAAAHKPNSPYAAIASGKADVEGGVIQVAARTAGIVTAVTVKEGDDVAKGELLAQLEDGPSRLAVAGAEASVAQARAQIHLIEVKSDYLFPAPRSNERPISDMTINAALRRLGYASDEVCGHGFRRMASTLLNEQGWEPDWIETQLAHIDRNKVRASYNAAIYLEGRKRMMQHWSDHLDGLSREAIAKAA